jgi:hypothetical protein
MNIILVGNSSNIIGQGLGEQIDQFDIVVRFNNFKIDGYENDVGRKIDWVCYRACDDVKLIKPDQLSRAFFFITYCIHTQGMKKVARQQKSFYGSKGTVVDEIQCLNLAKQMKFKTDLTEWPSIGALAACYFSTLDELEKIYTVGFGGDPTSHYFPKPPKDHQYHNWGKEQQFLNSAGITVLTKA